MEIDYVKRVKTKIINIIPLVIKEILKSFDCIIFARIVDVLS